jgi:gamma-glutamyltranspeptidase/glutathione hydrolase
MVAAPEGAAVYAPGGRLLRAGDTLRNPDLAATFELIAELGFDRARREVVEPAILATLSQSGGLITAEDLAGYEVIERRPLEARYRDAALLTNPPPSSGGVLIAAALRWLDARPAPRSALEHYLGAVRAGEVANAMRDERFPEDLHHDDAIDRVLARRAGPARKPTGTTHISAVDAEGGMASFSSSNGSASGVVAAGTGVLLNNMMGEEDLNPGGLGLTRPGRRLSSMMAPTIVMRGGRPHAALGSAGSNRLRSAILQTVMSLIDADLPPAEAVARPRVHPEGDGVDVEGGVPEEAVAALAADGLRLRRWEGMNLFFGGVSAVRTGDGPPTGAGDPRRGGGAAAATADGRVVPL